MWLPHLWLVWGLLPNLHLLLSFGSQTNALETNYLICIYLYTLSTEKPLNIVNFLYFYTLFTRLILILWKFIKKWSEAGCGRVERKFDAQWSAAGE